MTRSRQLAAILALATLLAGPSVAAQPLHSASGADAYFRDGRAAMKRGDYPSAYSLLQQSYSLDPTPGALLNIADCEEHMGKLLEALEHFTATATALPSTDPRRTIAAGRASDLDHRLPHLVVHVSGAQNAVSLVLEGSVDGPNGSIQIPAGMFVAERSTALLPGSYNVRGIDGQVVREQAVALRTVETAELTFDFVAIRREDAQKQAALEASMRGTQDEAARAQQATVAAATAQSRELQAQAQRQVNAAIAGAADGGHTARMLGLGLAFGVPGLVMLTLGTVGGVQVLSDKSTVSQNCRGNACTQTGLDAAHDGQVWNVIGTVGFGVGAVLVGTGTYLMIKTARDQTTTLTSLGVQATQGGAGLTLVQGF